jgi:hypothetical protein
MVCSWISSCAKGARNRGALLATCQCGASTSNRAKSIRQRLSVRLVSKSLAILSCCMDNDSMLYSVQVQEVERVPVVKDGALLVPTLSEQ